MMTHSTPSSTASRSVIRTAAITIGSVVVLSVIVACSIAVQPQPQATTESRAAAEPSPVPTVAPVTEHVDEPVDEPVALPTDCRQAYTSEFLDLLAGVELNDPSLADVVISRFEGVENIREALPGIECKWGLPTEGGMSNAVNGITVEQESELIAAAEDEGFTCESAGEGISLCRYSQSSSDGVYEWTVSEELYLRDSLLVTTWRASTGGSMEDSTQPVYDRLWP